MWANSFHEAVCKEPTPCRRDNIIRWQNYLLLIVFAVSLFLFLAQKVARLLEIRVYLLTDPILSVRKAIRVGTV